LRKAASRTNWPTPSTASRKSVGFFARHYGIVRVDLLQSALADEESSSEWSRRPGLLIDLPAATSSDHLEVSRCCGGAEKRQETGVHEVNLYATHAWQG